MNDPVAETTKHEHDPATTLPRPPATMNDDFDCPSGRGMGVMMRATDCSTTPVGHGAPLAIHHGVEAGCCSRG